MSIVADLKAAGAAIALPAFPIYTQFQVFRTTDYLLLKIAGLVLVLYWMIAGFATIVIVAVTSYQWFRDVGRERIKRLVYKLENLRSQNHLH